VEIGVFTFADTRRDPESGDPVGAEQRLREVVEEAELADEVGLDVFGVGEHHRPDFTVSTPAVVLAALPAAVHDRRDPARGDPAVDRAPRAGGRAGRPREDRPQGARERVIAQHRWQQPQ
jgi:hypothetical protein